VLTKAIWAGKNGLVSDRLACTSSKTEILNFQVPKKVPKKLEK